MIYLVVFILLVILAAKFDFSKSDKRNENFWYNFVLLIFIAIAGLRYKTGGDSLSYIQSFKEIPFFWQLDSFNFSEAQFDPLWIIFSSISKSIINDFTFFQIIHAIIINFVIFRFIKQNTIYRFTTVLLYYLFFYLYFNMEIMRESLAVSAFLLGYPYFKERKWLKFYIYVFIAFLFHSSAIILFIFPLFRYIKIKPITIILLVLFFVLTMFMSDTFKTILSIFIFNERISSRFETYSSIKLNNNGMLSLLFVYFLIPAFIVYLAEKKLGNKPIFKELYFTYFLFAVITVGFSGFSRFINYLTPFMAVYFGIFLNKVYRNKPLLAFKRLAVIVLLVIAFVPKFIYYFKDTSMTVDGTRQYDLWYPYNSVFSKEENYDRQKLFDGIMSSDKRY